MDQIGQFGYREVYNGQHHINYMMVFYLLPKYIHQKMDAIRVNFFWQGAEDNNKYHMARKKDALVADYFLKLTGGQGLSHIFFMAIKGLKGHYSFHFLYAEVGHDAQAKRPEVGEDAGYFEELAAKICWSTGKCALSCAASNRLILDTKD
ncbi:hypothetical protein ACJX0J_006923, partial [Zea mays]